MLDLIVFVGAGIGRGQPRRFVRRPVAVRARAALALDQDICAILVYGCALRKEGVMDDKDRIYFARRAAEEEELADAANDPTVAKAHRDLQRAYLERARIAARPMQSSDPVG